MSATLCRLCLKDDGSLNNIFDLSRKKGINLKKRIRACFGIEVSYDDDTPKSICKKCFDLTSTIYTVRQTCITNNQLLQKELSSEPPPPVTVKTEPKDDERRETNELTSTTSSAVNKSVDKNSTAPIIPEPEQKKECVKTKKKLNDSVCFESESVQHNPVNNAKTETTNSKKLSWNDFFKEGIHPSVQQILLHNTGIILSRTLMSKNFDAHVVLKRCDVNGRLERRKRQSTENCEQNKFKQKKVSSNKIKSAKEGQQTCNKIIKSYMKTFSQNNADNVDEFTGGATIKCTSPALVQLEALVDRTNNCSTENCDKLHSDVNAPMEWKHTENKENQNNGVSGPAEANSTCVQSPKTEEGTPVIVSVVSLQSEDAAKELGVSFEDADETGSDNRRILTPLSQFESFVTGNMGEEAPVNLRSPGSPNDVAVPAVCSVNTNSVVPNNEESISGGSESKSNCDNSDKPERTASKTIESVSKIIADAVITSDKCAPTPNLSENFARKHVTKLLRNRHSMSSSFDYYHDPSYVDPDDDDEYVPYKCKKSCKKNSQEKPLVNSPLTRSSLCIKDPRLNPKVLLEKIKVPHKTVKVRTITKGDKEKYVFEPVNLPNKRTGSLGLKARRHSIVPKYLIDLQKQLNKTHGDDTKSPKLQLEGSMNDEALENIIKESLNRNAKALRNKYLFLKHTAPEISNGFKNVTPNTVEKESNVSSVSVTPHVIEEQKCSVNNTVGVATNINEKSNLFLNSDKVSVTCTEEEDVVFVSESTVTKQILLERRLNQITRNLKEISSKNKKTKDVRIVLTKPKTKTDVSKSKSKDTKNTQSASNESKVNTPLNNNDKLIVESQASHLYKLLNVPYYVNVGNNAYIPCTLNSVASTASSSVNVVPSSLPLSSLPQPVYVLNNQQPTMTTNVTQINSTNVSVPVAPILPAVNSPVIPLNTSIAQNSSTVIDNSQSNHHSTQPANLYIANGKVGEGGESDPFSSILVSYNGNHYSVVPSKSTKKLLIDTPQNSVSAGSNMGVTSQNKQIPIRNTAVMPRNESNMGVTSQNKQILITSPVVVPRNSSNVGVTSQHKQTPIRNPAVMRRNESNMNSLGMPINRSHLNATLQNPTILNGHLSAMAMLQNHHLSNVNRTVTSQNKQFLKASSTEASQNKPNTPLMTPATHAHIKPLPPNLLYPIMNMSRAVSGLNNSISVNNRKPGVETFKVVKPQNMTVTTLANKNQMGGSNMQVVHNTNTGMIQNSNVNVNSNAMFQNSNNHTFQHPRKDVAPSSSSAELWHSNCQTVQYSNVGTVLNTNATAAENSLGATQKSLSMHNYTTRVKSTLYVPPTLSTSAVYKSGPNGTPLLRVKKPEELNQYGIYTNTDFLC